MLKVKILIIVVVAAAFIAAAGLVLWNFFQPNIPYLPGTAHEASSVIEDGNAGE